MTPSRRHTDRPYVGTADHARWKDDAMRLIAQLETALGNERVRESGAMLNLLDVLRDMLEDAQ